MDGSVTTTLAALLVLCAIAPASQQAVLDSQSAAAVPLVAFDNSMLPAESLSLALHSTRVPVVSSKAAKLEQRTGAQSGGSHEHESAEADPSALKAEDGAAAVASIPVPDAGTDADAEPVPESAAEPRTEPDTELLADTDTDLPAQEAAKNSAELNTAADEQTEGEQTSEAFIANSEFTATEMLLDEQQPVAAGVTELLEATETAPAADEIKQQEAVAALVSAVEPGSKKLKEQIEPFEMLDGLTQAGTMKRLTWNATEAFSGTTVPTPILVAHGTKKGPVLCLTAAVHGDELNGIETVRRVIHEVVPEKLSGTLIGVPIVNMAGFQRHSRYLPDRRDLNRFFPGHPRGSSASRIAFSFFREVIVHCDALVDLHTGSFHRTNLPQLRANLNNEAVVKLTEGFGSTIILHSDGGVGTLRRAAVEAGIPAVTLEAGEPLRLQDDEVRHSVKGIFTLLETFGMYDKRGIRGSSEPVYYTSEWVRADTGGILFSSIKLGKRIKRDDLLGTVTDPISNEREEIRSPFSGRVIGMALNQFVMPGFATYHIGIEADDADDAKLDEEPVILSHDVAFEPDMEAVEE